MGREFRRVALQLTWRVHCPGHTGRVRYGRPEANGYFSNVLRVRSSDVSREFRQSGVSAFIGSSDASHYHYNLVTIGAV